MTPLTEVELMARKLIIELAREIFVGVEGERESEEKDRETAEVIHMRGKQRGEFRKRSS